MVKFINGCNRLFGLLFAALLALTGGLNRAFSGDVYPWRSETSAVLAEALLRAQGVTNDGSAWIFSGRAALQRVNIASGKTEAVNLRAIPEALRKAFGVVAVAAGEGIAKILKSLGVDVVVSGGQTMNPSTADLLDAVEQAHADKVVILPNNSNIIMAANSAAELAEVECGVVPTKSVPQAFSAMFGFNAEASLEDNVEAMTDAFADVRTGEVTTAIKDSHDAKGGDIAAGDVIGIADGSIDAVGTTVEDVVMELLAEMEAEDADTCTLLAGADYPDDALDALVERIEAEYDDIEIDAHRGEQPLYPIILSVE